jgi:hypothetical protein
LVLGNKKPQIESEIGYPLEWEELPSGQDSRIARYLDGVDPTDVVDWQRQHDWLAETMNEMHRVFALRVRALQVADDIETLRPNAAA